MFGKKPRLNPLQSRKQMLIAESELNRAQLAEEWQNLAGEVRALGDRAKSWTAIAASAAALVAGLTALSRDQRTDPGKKSSRLSRILRLAGLGSTLWMAFHSQRREESTPSNTT